MQPSIVHERQNAHQQLLNKILEEQKNKEGNLLPILHAVQDPTNTYILQKKPRFAATSVQNK